MCCQSRFCHPTYLHTNSHLPSPRNVRLLTYVSSTQFVIASLSPRTEGHLNHPTEVPTAAQNRPIFVWSQPFDPLSPSTRPTDPGLALHEEDTLPATLAPFDPTYLQDSTPRPSRYRFLCRPLPNTQLLRTHILIGSWGSHRSAGTFLSAPHAEPPLHICSSRPANLAVAIDRKVALPERAGDATAVSDQVPP